MRPLTLACLLFVASCAAARHSSAVIRIPVVEAIRHPRNEQLAVLNTMGAPRTALYFQLTKVVRWVYCRPRQTTLAVDFDSNGQIIATVETLSDPLCR